MTKIFKTLIVKKQSDIDILIFVQYPLYGGLTLNVASLDVQKMSKTSFEGFMFFELYQVSMEYLIEYMFLSFIVHYDTPYFETYFNTYYNKKLITRNYSELQRPTAIQKKNAKRFATVTQRHKTVEIMSTMTHNNAKQIQTLHKK